MNDNNKENNAQDTNNNILQTSESYTEQSQAKQSPFSNYYSEEERKNSPITRAKVLNLIVSIIHLFVLNPIVSSYIQIFLIDNDKNSTVFRLLYLFLSILWILYALWLILVSSKKLKRIFYIILFGLIIYQGYAYYSGNDVFFKKINELNDRTQRNYFITESKAVITLAKKQIIIDKNRNIIEDVTCFISDNKMTKIYDSTKKCRYIKGVSNKEDNIYYAVIINNEGKILKFLAFNDHYYVDIDSSKDGEIKLELFDNNNILQKGIYINDTLGVSSENDEYKFDFN